MLLSWFVLLRRTFAGLLLGPLFDSVDLMAPEAFVGFDPIVHGLKLPGVESIHAASAAPAHRNDADAAQHTQMFRHRRLRDAERADEIADRAFTRACQKVDDRAATRLGDGIEDVGGCGGPRQRR